ncbi:MAG: hypothetical protein ABW193_03180 [Luteibacter sp.]
MSLHFKRPQIAAELATAVLGRSVLSSTTLFLGAPRRTGKSTFLLEDLRPALSSAGALVLYVDLWKNQAQPPSDLIAFTVASALAEAQGFVARTAQAVGLSKVSIRGVEFSLAAVGKHPGASLADSLAELVAATRRPVALIVDEAQQAIRTKEGMAAMYSLKSARDTINAPGQPRLGLILSGSDRDKLLRLVHGGGAPFMGSNITDLPLLDRGFSDFMAGHLATEKPSLPIDNGRMYDAFERVHFRPEELRNAIDAIAGPFGMAQGANFHDLLDQQVASYEQTLHDGYVTTYLGLTKMQRAVLTRVLSSSRENKLFSADALADYSRAHGRRVDPGAARAAVEKLRQADPPLIWKSARGDYAPEDSGMRQWYERLHAAGQWPPAI